MIITMCNTANAMQLSKDEALSVGLELLGYVDVFIMLSLQHEYLDHVIFQEGKFRGTKVLGYISSTYGTFAMTFTLRYNSIKNETDIPVLTVSLCVVRTYIHTYIHTYSFIRQTDRTHLHKIIEIHVKIQIKA